MKLRVALALLLTALNAPAKGRTLKIVIESVGSEPVEITDKVGQFGVWEGPGVTINGEPQMDGFIVEWRKGAATARPPGLERYRVSFFTGCLPGEDFCRNPGARLTYIVLYEFDRSSNTGYVYIPSRLDEAYKINGPSIARLGFDGKWFIATEAWRDFVASSPAARSRGTD